MSDDLAPVLDRIELDDGLRALQWGTDLVARCTRAWTDKPVALAGSGPVDVAAQRARGDHVRAWGRSARSLWGWLARRSAFHAAVDELDADGVLLTGAVDPVIPASSATACLQRHPGWTHIDLPGVGHVPPLESPDRTADAIVG